MLGHEAEIKATLGILMSYTCLDIYASREKGRILSKILLVET